MGARRLHKKRGHHQDNFDILTTNVHERLDGSVLKTSEVTIRAKHDQKLNLWVGLKIARQQQVLDLRVNEKRWVTKRSLKVRSAADEFAKLFPPKPGEEKWVAYEVEEAAIPHSPANSFQINTSLVLDRHVVKFPDAQVVTICACYVPAGGNLSAGAVIAGHSLIPAPRPGQKKRGKRR